MWIVKYFKTATGSLCGKNKCPEKISIPLSLGKWYTCRYCMMNTCRQIFHRLSNTRLSPGPLSDFLRAPRPSSFPPQGALSFCFLNLILPFLLYIPPSLLPICSLISLLFSPHTHTHVHTHAHKYLLSPHCVMAVGYQYCVETTSFSHLLTVDCCHGNTMLSL